jgi:hypothetical protein
MTNWQRIPWQSCSTRLGEKTNPGCNSTSRRTPHSKGYCAGSSLCRILWAWTSLADSEASRERCPTARRKVGSCGSLLANAIGQLSAPGGHTSHGLARARSCSIVAVPRRPGAHHSARTRAGYRGKSAGRSRRASWTSAGRSRRAPFRGGVRPVWRRKQRAGPDTVCMETRSLSVYARFADGNEKAAKALPERDRPDSCGWRA